MSEASNGSHPTVAHIRSYFQAVYRDAAAAHWPSSVVLRRFAQLEWIYHREDEVIPYRGVGRTPWKLGCGHSFHSPRAAICTAAAAGEPTVGSVFCTPIKVRAMNWFGFWRPSWAAACGRQAPPRYHEDGSWVEVLRIGTIAVSGPLAAVRRFGEGGGHGCWFLASSGSGVFLHAGRSIRASSRAELATALGLNLTHLAREGWNSPWVEMHPRTRLCAAAAARGYDTIQLVEEGCAKSQSADPRRACYLEMVSCHPGCLAMPSKAHYRACVPGVPLRTGWGASAHCECDNSLLLVNCLGDAHAARVPALSLAGKARASTRAAHSPPTKVLLNATFPEGKRQAVAPLAFRPFAAQVRGACPRVPTRARPDVRACDSPWGK